MALDARGTRDLQWLLQGIKSRTLALHSISFHLLQSTSGCWYEAETSMIVNISSNSISYFSCILQELAAAEGACQLLESIDFNRVKWLPEQLHSLLLLLENNSSIRRLKFQKNSFTLQLLSQFSLYLKRNCALKEVMLLDSGIGPEGAKILATALALNESLEQLHIRRDSIGWKGAQELAKMIELNSSLRLLRVLDSDSASATPLISAVLERNRLMEVHVWSKEEGDKSSKVAEFIPENGTLRIFQMTVSGCCSVNSSLLLNLTVTVLDMTGIRLKSRWAKVFRKVLEQNQTLKEVNLSKTSLRDNGAKHIAAGLFKNQSIEKLHLHGNCFSSTGIEFILCPLSRFSSMQIQANTTIKSITLGGVETKIGRDGLAAIIRFLTTNHVITFLEIYDDQSLEPEDIITMLKCLHGRTSLVQLSLQGCKGVRGEAVKEAAMESLRANHSIEGINLERTPLHSSGDYRKFEGNLMSKGGSLFEIEKEFLEDMPLVIPKSCRFFLCGHELAGKTTLCNSIAQHFSAVKVPYLEHNKDLGPVSQGLKIKTFRDGDTKISVWNILGRLEFYSLRDLMFPENDFPFFIIVSSLFKKPITHSPKPPTEIEEDICHWLRFIVSTSRIISRQCFLPKVTIVLTHFDKIIHPSHCLEDTMSLIERLKETFSGDIDVFPSIFTVDARSPTSLRKLGNHLCVMKNMIVQKIPRIYNACSDLAKFLSDWMAENRNQPAMTWKDFSELCQVKVPYLQVKQITNNNEMMEQMTRDIATCLHNMGELIYFQDLGFLILDIKWFSSVLSLLFQLKHRKKRYVENDFISRKELEKTILCHIRSNLPGDESKTFGILQPIDFLRMMMKLELCYEQDPSNPNSHVLVPSILVEGKENPQWQLYSQTCIFIGRRFQCDDSSNMLLLPASFPRLQVNLRHRVMQLKNQYGATYDLEKHLISLNFGGMSFRVELGGQAGQHIDILACSSRNLTETLRLLHQIIIPAVHSACSGVAFTENVIRPECVRCLLPHRYRKTQLVSLQYLEEEVLSVPADAMYDYKHVWSREIESGRVIINDGFDLARGLLSDDDFRDILHQRYRDLYDLAGELEVPLENDTEKTGDGISLISDSVEASLGGIAKGVELVLQRLKIIEQEIKDLKQEIQGLKHYEHRLLTELHRKVDYLVNFNVQVEERKVPNMFYFVQSGNYMSRLVTTMVAGMTALRLHMLCEFRREMHVVEDQVGLEIMQIDSIAVRCLAPYTKKFMKLLTFALRIGAQLAAGMGHMIPDLSREIGYLRGSSMAYGTGGVAAGAIGAAGVLALGNIVGSRGEGNIQQDVVAAQQWIVDFLRERMCSSGKDIAEKFGLWRVRYRDDGQVAWICRRHMYSRGNEVIEVPI